jgi:hypothetical protein
MEDGNALDRCPECRRQNVLIALGRRIDHLHRWRRWVGTITELYLCDHCDALVEVRSAHSRGEPAVQANAA